MTAIHNLTTSLGHARRGMDATSQNLTRASKPGAVRHSVEMLHDGRGGIQCVETRVINDSAHKTLLEQTSKANGTKVQARYAAEIDQVFGDVTSDLSFSTRLDRSFASLQALTTAGAVDSHQIVAALGHSVKVVQDTAGDLFSLALKVEEELSSSIVELNSLVEQLYNNNQAIANATNESIRLDLQDVRDDILNRFAQYVSLEITYSSDGRAFVRGMGDTLVGQSTYSQLEYNARNYTDLTTGNEASVLTLATLDSGGRAVRRSDLTGIDSRDGQVAGLVHVRDEQLPVAINAVNAIATAIVDNANAVHNKFASLGNTKLQATRAMAATDSIKTSGKVRVTVVKKDGAVAEFSGAGGLTDQVRHVDVDLGAIHSMYGKGRGKATVQSLMAEITAQFSHNSAIDTVSMGAIANPTGGVYAGQNLLNDIQIVGTQNVTTNGVFEFDLELDNSSHFGSKIEILSTEVWSGGEKISDATDLPADINLSAGEKSRAGAAMRVTLPAAASEIRVKVRVIGDNGQVEEGTVSYNIDRTDPMQTTLVNKRLKGVPGPIAGDMVVRADFMPTMLQTKMVDSAGNQVLDPNIVAFAVLETVSDEYNVIIEDLDSIVTSVGGVTRGCCHLFGFNNLFTGDAAVNPALELSIVSRILDDVNLLASTHIEPHHNVTANYEIGDAAAHQIITFITDGTLAGVGDTLTIGSEEFRFVAVGGAVPTANEIVIGADWDGTLTNIVAQISAHPNLSSLVNIVREGQGGIKVTARNAGVSGNSITMSCDLTASGARVKIGDGVAANHIGPTVFVGGTNKDAELQTVPELGWSFVAGNSFASMMAGFGQMPIVFGGSKYVNSSVSTTLSAVTSRTQQAAVRGNTDAEYMSKVASGTLERLAQSFNATYGIDKDLMFARLMEETQYLNMLTAMLQLLQRSNSEMINRLAG